jgi:hypothetical protein
MEDGWTRYFIYVWIILLADDVWRRSYVACDLSDITISCFVSLDDIDQAWLSQANHNFSLLSVTSNYEDYGASHGNDPSEIMVDLGCQYSYPKLSSIFESHHQEKTCPTDTYFSVRFNTFKRARPHFDSQTFQRTGPLIHPARNV